MAVALTTQCPYCIEIHASNARKAGANDTELTEAAMVAASLRAGAAVTHAESCAGWLNQHYEKELPGTFLHQASRLDLVGMDVGEVLNRVAPAIANLAGAAEAQEMLGQAGLDFVQRLRASAGDDPSLRVALARLLLHMSEMQNPGNANTVGDYEAGLKRAQEALELVSTESLPLGPAALGQRTGLQNHVGRVPSRGDNSDEALGFKFTDIEILLTSHAHSDHASGHALVKELTGARVEVMEGDASVIANGGKANTRWVSGLRGGSRPSVSRSRPEAAVKELNALKNLHISAVAYLPFLSEYTIMVCSRREHRGLGLSWPQHS